MKQHAIRMNRDGHKKYREITSVLYAESSEAIAIDL